MKVNINKLKHGNWIYNTSGVYKIIKIYKAAGGTFYTVREVIFDPNHDDIFTFGEEYDMTPADVKQCEIFYY